MTKIDGMMIAEWGLGRLVPLILFLVQLILKTPSAFLDIW